ncbi:MAG: hypothetical protein R3B57_10945 [Phycisphaerales bacterium]
MSVVEIERTARGEAAREEARRVFGRVLAQWAGDCLRLRRAGLDRPCRREGGVSGIGWGSGSGARETG